MITTNLIVLSVYLTTNQVTMWRTVGDGIDQWKFVTETTNTVVTTNYDIGFLQGTNKVKLFTTSNGTVNWP